jgi:hypothetical protein
VALSIVFPPDDPDLSGELRSLRRLLGDEVMIIVGGRAAGGYRAVIEEIGALWLPDAPEAGHPIEDVFSIRTQRCVVAGSDPQLRNL